MIIKQIIDEDVVNYKKTSMVIAFPRCSFKCGNECQNKHLVNMPDIEIEPETIIKRYLKNPFTSAVVLQGLEPLDSWADVIHFIEEFREVCNDDIVVYTGYNYPDDKTQLFISAIKGRKHSNVIIKVGGYVENSEPVWSPELGVELASSNQYAFKINIGN